MESILNDNLIEKFLNISKTVNLRLIGSESDYFHELKKFLLKAESSFPWLDLEIEEIKDTTHIEYGFLKFYGRPTGNGLEKFLQAISEISVEKTLENRFSFDFFVAAMCPHCPAAFRVLIDFIKENPFKTTLYFSDDTHKEVEENNIMSVPTLIIKEKGVEKERLTGSLNKDDLTEFVKGRGLENLSEEYFINLLEQGRAEDVAKEISENHTLSGGFVSLFLNEKWSVRLGAIVAGEFLADISSITYEALLDELEKKYKGVSPQVKGDILYLLGLSSERSKWIIKIKELIRNESDDTVLEAAMESLENMRE